MEYSHKEQIVHRPDSWSDSNFDVSPISASTERFQEGEGEKNIHF